MMEKVVEIPTIYFAPPSKQDEFGLFIEKRSKTLPNIEFWNSFSQFHQSNTTTTISQNIDIISRQNNSRHSQQGKCCDSNDSENPIVVKWEKESQSDHSSQNLSCLIHQQQDPAITTTPRSFQPKKRSSRTSTRSNAKLKLQFKWHQVFLVISLLTLSLFCQVSEECPQSCECKWKSGKESVICANGKTKLTAIPSGLEPGTQLLDLSKNNILSLQSKVFHSLNLLNLQKIFLSECNLKTLDKNVFYKLNNLVELDLSGNKLDSIPTPTFDQILELRELKLNSNPVTRISANAFSSLKHLVRLELSKCRIRSVDSAAFRNLVSLEWLKLDNNRLLTIHVVSFYPLRNLHGLELHENPWNCSCTLQPLRDWMTKNNVPYGIPPLCDQPPRLSSKSWDALQGEDFACLPKVQSSVLAETGELTKAIEGENATLVCRLQATADTQVRWMNGKKAVALSSSSSTRYSLSESFIVQGSGGDGEKVATPLPNTSKQTLGTKTSKLTVIRTKQRDSGLYSCRAETRAGSISVNFTLQVLQLSAEHLSGRFLLYGATVAAFLTLSICLLLLCVVFFCGKTKSRIPATTTQDKIELNHVPRRHNQNGGRLLQNGHTTTRNGGTLIPLLQDHNNHVNNNNTNNANGAPPNYRSSILSNFNIINLNKRSNPDIGRSSAANNGSNNPQQPPSSSSRGLLNPQYKVLPTNDDNPISDNHGEDDDEDDNNDEEPESLSHSDIEGENENKKHEDFLTCSTKRNSKVVIVNVPETQSPKEQKFPDLINDEKSPPSSNHNRNVEQKNMVQGLPQNMQLSVRPKALLPLNNQPTPTASTTITLESTSNKPSVVLPHHRPTCNLPPKEISEQSHHSSPKQIPNGGATSTFPIVKQSVESTSKVSSNSNLSKNYDSNTPKHRKTTSPPTTFTKFTFTQQRQAPPIPAPRHQRTLSFSATSDTSPNSVTSRLNPNPNHISFYRQSTGQQYHHPQFQRRSMPTSPIHLSSSSTYHQYHHHPYQGAYNKFQGQGSDPGLINHHEFVGQSQEYDYHAAQLAAFLEEYRQLQMELMRMSASLTEMDPNQPSSTGQPNGQPMMMGPNSNINLNSMDPMMMMGSQQRSTPKQNSNVDFHQQQFNNKSILKSSGSNNNYLV